MQCGTHTLHGAVPPLRKHKMMHHLLSTMLAWLIQEFLNLKGVQTFAKIICISYISDKLNSQYSGPNSLISSNIKISTDKWFEFRKRVKCISKHWKGNVITGQRKANPKSGFNRRNFLKRSYVSGNIPNFLKVKFSEIVTIYLQFEESWINVIDKWNLLSDVDVYFAWRTALTEYEKSILYDGTICGTYQCTFPIMCVGRVGALFLV